MILFDLRCSHGHEFEAWFRDGASFEKQSDEGSIPCPVCGDRAVTKALMAPAVAPSRARIEAERAARTMQLLRKVQDHVEKTFDHVGPRFADEARKMHSGEVEKRNIYGETTAEEAKALREEGIEVSQIPWLPRHDA